MGDLTVANTILKQMGGSNKLTAMLGAFNFSGGEKSLTFRFKMCKKANCIKITLNSLDLYDIEFFKIRKFEFPLIKRIDGLYFDQLNNTFENFTGLATTL